MQKTTKGITKDSLDYLKDVLDAMSDGAYIVNRHCDIEYVNPVIAREFGAPGNQKCYKYFHSRKQVCPWCVNKEVFEGKSVSWRWFNPRTGRTYDLFDNPLRNPDGSLSKLEFFHEVTDLVKTQEDLRISNAFLNSMIEQSPTPTWISNDKGTLIRINQACCTLFNITEKDVVGKYNIFKDNLVDSQGFMPLVENVFNKGELTRFELKYDTSQLKNLNLERQASVFLDVTIFPIIDHNGKVTNAVIQHIDITTRKAAEEALRKSEDRYRTLVDNAAEGIFVIQNGKVVFANPRAFAMVDYRLDEREPKHFVDFVHPEDRAIVIERHLRRLSGEELEETYTIRLIDRHGNIRWVRITSAGINWENSPATLTLATDITDHRLDEEKIRESEGRYHSLFENMLNGVVYCRMIFEDARPQDFVFISVNDTFGKLKGLKNIIGKRATEVIPGIRESNPELFEIFGRVSLSGKSERFETFLSTPDMWFSVSAYSTEKGYFVALFDNITERKQSEEKLLKSYAALKKTLNDAINTMSKMVEMRDPYTAGHQRDVATLSAAIASEMKLSDDQIERLRMAATMHDIGKIYVPSEILSKPGKLDRLEFEIIKTHPQGGYDIIKGMDFPCAVAQTVLQHHERLDGSGYPSGLGVKDISIEARILAVADVVEAMSSHRPYRPSRGTD